MSFKDHFSSRSADYAAYRPTYPPELADYLAGLCETPDVALDVGCGNGQLSVLLAGRFASVLATDASARQIESAVPHERVTYRVAPAERSGLPERSVDLVTAAQAAHWFDLPAFYEEVRRVAKPGGVLALVTYGVIRADPDIDPVVQHFYKDVIGPYWPPERRHVEEGYRGFDFPFPELTPPDMDIAVSWRAADLIGYADTWSAVRAAEKALGREPIDAFARDLVAAWGDPERRRTIRFPLSFRIGRV
ncbi:class I SAM-dependent methyltransferase [Microvirga thermotolerans]|uniref:Methyltransferase domain-containing protein n=1 Tax=Microvirga thermotolerans TaxID=2651334 RepID=A0A5P9K4I3_9HYPH|nr:class I SAM-dependent methyltransferase [Microvirga thermotolerans]QFU17324.1 methyltransferase domain-containing protein [Microvirga thermotolerans]